VAAEQVFRRGRHEVLEALRELRRVHAGLLEPPADEPQPLGIDPTFAIAWDSCGDALPAPP